MNDLKTPEQTSEREVRVYNRFQQRSLIHGGHRAAPNTFTTIPESVAKVWMERYPNDIVEAATAQRELGGAAAEIAELKVKLAAAQDRVKELETRSSSKASPKTGIGGRVVDVV